jgi:hypothetical protein
LTKPHTAVHHPILMGFRSAQTVFALSLGLGLSLGAKPAAADDVTRPGEKKVSSAGKEAQVTAAATDADDDDGPDTAEGAAIAKKGNRVQISGTDKIVAQKCTPEVEVYIDGNHIAVTLTGDCKLVSVTGAENNVKVDAAAKIVLAGRDNVVHYRRGRTSGDPEVVTGGTGNKAVKIVQEKPGK